MILDESGSDLKQARDYARAEGGTRAKAPKPHCPGKKFSIIGVISIFAITAMMYIESAINGSIFFTFVKELLLPKLGPGKYLIMDNINFHKNSAVIELIESTGTKVVYLPPYSPDLSPIEKMWSKIKTILKSIRPRTESEFHDVLFHAANEVDQDDLQAWFEDCGYKTA